MKEGKVQEVVTLLEKEQEIAPDHERLAACLRYMKRGWELLWNKKQLYSVQVLITPSLNL